MKETIGVIGGSLLVLVACTFGMVQIGAAAESWQCRKYQEATGLPTKYVRFDRCYVQTDSGWRSLKQVRAE